MVDCEAVTSQGMTCGSKEELLRIFRPLKWFGYFPIEVDLGNSKYIVQRRCLYISYFAWYFLITTISIAWLVWFGDVELILKDKVVGGLLIFFVVGFAPGLTTFAINRITVSLPTILEEIFSLFEMDTEFHRSSAKRSKRDIILYMVPMVVNTVFVEVYLLLIITPEFSEPETYNQTGKFVLIICIFIFQPCLTTLLCVKFIGILYIRIFAIRNHFDISYENFRKSLPLGEFSPADWEDVLKTAGDHIEKLQEILRLINDGFMKYVTTVNFLIYFVTSIPCIMVMLRVNSLESVVYAFPVTCSVFSMQAICSMSSWLRNEYENLLFTIRRLSLLERRYPGRLPYGELLKLQELLRSSPLQVVTLGGIPVGLRLSAAMTGFILTYTVLIEDLLNVKKVDAKPNGTDFLNESYIDNLTNIVNVTDINN